MRRHWFLLLVIFLFALMVSLGCWQLRRYHAKQLLLDQYHHNSHIAPLIWHGAEDIDCVEQVNHKQSCLFHRVRVTGHYLNDKTLLLDNRWYHESLGYEPLTPFQINGDKKVLLVRRAWVAAGKQRQQLPSIEPLLGERSFIAYVRSPPKPGFMLGDNIEPGKSWPLRIQQINLDDISKVTGLVFYPYVLQQDALYDWQLFTVMPSRHLAYAIQWFLMSVVLVIVYLVFLLS